MSPLNGHVAPTAERTTIAGYHCNANTGSRPPCASGSRGSRAQDTGHTATGSRATYVGCTCIS